MLKRVRNRQEDALAGISWQEFERLLAKYYENHGFQVEHCGTAGSGSQYDGGIDLKLRKADQYILVQCKHWNARQVPHNDVHQLMGIMENEDASGAVLITSGEFTAAAKQAAEKKGRIQLIDGIQLREMLGPILPLTPTSSQELTPSWRQVVDMGTDVAFDAIDRRRGRRPSSMGQTLVWVAIAKLVMPIVFVLFVFWMIQNMGHQLAISLQPRPKPASSVPPTVSQKSPYSFAPSSSNNGAVDPAKPSPVAQIGSAAAMTDPAALAEWKRKNDEAMRILEATTPELGQGASRPPKR